MLMCYFITVGIPDEDVPLLDDHLPRGLDLAPSANPSVLEQMGPGFRTYLLTSGGCSCDLFRKPRTATEHDEQELLRHKYEKKGWSAAKIDRALAQRRQSRGPEPSPGLAIVVQRFLAQLATRAGQVAVLVHWYRGDVEKTQFACKTGRVLPAETVSAEGLPLEADEIVRVKRRG
jgi:hypothetical protein